MSGGARHGDAETPIASISRRRHRRRALAGAVASLWLLASPGIAHEGGPARPGHAAAGRPHADALGKPGDPARVTRAIDVDMTDDMRFAPDHIRVKRGETIRFRLTNRGRLTHEMVLGTPGELRAHAALMLKFPEMQHADPNQATAPPGTTRELVWTFTQAGSFTFACLQPGHYEAGMHGNLIVIP